jgi:hypothetical protein
MAAPLIPLGPYVSGATIPLAISVSYDGAAIDATDVVVRLRSPLGVVSSYSFSAGDVLHGLTGEYTIALTAGAAPPRGYDGWTYSVTATLPTTPTVEVGIQAGPLLIVADPTA